MILCATVMAVDACDGWVTLSDFNQGLAAAGLPLDNFDYKAMTVHV